MFDIKRIVERNCRKYGTRDPFRLAKERHISVIFEPLGSVRGFYQGCYRNKIIHINSNITEEQQRFTCAHELGHALMHAKVNTPFLRENTLFSVNRYEVEANRFAAQLCYPAQYLREEFGACTTHQIAQSLGLPPELVEYVLRQG